MAKQNRNQKSSSSKQVSSDQAMKDMVLEVARRLSGNWKQDFSGKMSRLAEVAAEVLTSDLGLPVRNAAALNLATTGCAPEAPWNTGQERLNLWAAAWNADMLKKAGTSQVVYPHARLCASALVLICRMGFAPKQVDEIRALVRASRPPATEQPKPAGVLELHDLGKTLISV